MFGITIAEKNGDLIQITEMRLFLEFKREMLMQKQSQLTRLHQVLGHVSGLPSFILDSADLLLKGVILNRDNQACALLLSVISACAVFSLNIVSIPVHAQGLNSPQEITGRYVNEAAGFEIELPEGWKGAITQGMSDTQAFAAGEFVFVAPNVTEGSNNPDDIALMWILTIERSKIEEAAASGVYGNFSQFMDSGLGCNLQEGPSNSYEKVNDYYSMHVKFECFLSETAKSDAYMFSTEQHYILIQFIGTSQSYDTYIASFEDSLHTLQINSPVSIKKALEEDYNVIVEKYTVDANGSDVELKVQTKVTLSDFEFSEEDKRISFTVEGQDGAQGFTVITIDKVLAAPYTVTINGEPTENFVIVEDRGDDGENELQIYYSQGVQEVSITGTSVVPEFPGVVVGIVVAGFLLYLITIGRVNISWPLH